MSDDDPLRWAGREKLRQARKIGATGREGGVKTMKIAKKRGEREMYSIRSKW